MKEQGETADVPNAHAIEGLCNQQPFVKVATKSFLEKIAGFCGWTSIEPTPLNTAPLEPVTVRGENPRVPRQ